MNKIQVAFHSSFITQHSSLSFVDDAAVEDGHVGLGFENLRGRDREQVFGVYDEVCEHPRGYHPLRLLLERGVRALGRVVAYGVPDRDSLLGPPAARGLALRALPRDRGVEAEVRADGLDG